MHFKFSDLISLAFCIHHNQLQKNVLQLFTSILKAYLIIVQTLIVIMIVIYMHFLDDIPE